MQEGLKRINDYAFKGCNSIVEIVFPEGLQWVGLGAFWECNNLVKITVPESVTYIASYALGYGYNGLTLVVVEGSYAETHAKECDYNISIKQ